MNRSKLREIIITILYQVYIYESKGISYLLEDIIKENAEKMLTINGEIDPANIVNNEKNVDEGPLMKAIKNEYLINEIYFRLITIFCWIFTY